MNDSVYDEVNKVHEFILLDYLFIVMMFIYIYIRNDFLIRFFVLNKYLCSSQ